MTCEACDGQGQDWEAGWFCWSCEGTGEADPKKRAAILKADQKRRKEQHERYEQWRLELLRRQAMTHLPEETVLEMLQDSVDCRVPVRLRSDLEMMLRTYQQKRRLLLAEEVNHDWTSRWDENKAKIAACEELLKP